MKDKRFSAQVMDVYARTNLPPEFKVRAATKDRSAEVVMYGVIGDDLLAQDLMSALTEVGDGPVTIRTNSPGGSVWEGFAMYNMLRRRGNVTVAVDGVAASAAAFMAMGAEKVTMADTSQLMIHNSWSLALGDRHALTEAAKTMAIIDEQQARIFASRTGLPEQQITAMLDQETFMSAKTAVEMGFADEVTEQTEPVKRKTQRAQAPTEAMSEADFDRMVLDTEQMERLKQEIAVVKAEVKVAPAPQAPAPPPETPAPDLEVERRRRLARLEELES